MRIQEGSSSTHFELAAKSTPVTLTPGKGFRTESLLSSGAPKGCIATLVDWVKSLFQKIWNLLTCQFSSSKTKEASEVDEEATPLEQQIQEKLGEWLTPYYPHIEQFWEKMSFEEREAFFWQVTKNGLPAVTTEEIIQSLEWIKIAHPIYAKNREKLSIFLQNLKSQTASSSKNINILLDALIEKKREEPNPSETYIETNRETLDKLLKENENLASNYFSKYYADGKDSLTQKYPNLKLMVGQPLIFANGKVIVHNNKPFKFSGAVQSLAASVAIALTSMEGILYTPHDILLKLAEQIPDSKEHITSVDLTFNIYRLLFNTIKISNTFFIISKEPNLSSEPWGSLDEGQICLVAIEKNSQFVRGETHPIKNEQNEFYFLPLMKVD